MPRAQALAALQDWLQASAPECGFGTACRLHEGLVLACSTLNPEQIFCAIPRKLMMTAESGLASRAGPFFARDALCSSNASVTLAMHLWVESRFSDSNWAVYINSLPDDPSLPMSFPLAEFNLLVRLYILIAGLNVSFLS